MRFLAAFILSILPLTASAFQSQNLSNHLSWSVYIEEYTSGDLACVAGTRIRQGDSFDLVIGQEGELSLWILSYNDPVPEAFASDIVIDSETHTWDLYNAHFLPSGPHTSITFTFSPDKAPEFLSGLRRSNTVSLKTIDGAANYITWSLSGSSAAIDALFDCAYKIQRTW